MSRDNYQYKEGSQAQREALQVRARPSPQVLQVLQVLRLSSASSKVPTKADDPSRAAGGAGLGRGQEGAGEPRSHRRRIEALDSREDGGPAEDIAIAERQLHKVQLEEERVIRLFVSGKITEDQMDHQRRYITERLETLRARPDDYRDRETAEIEKRLAMEHVVEWVSRIGDGLDDLPDEERREVLRLLLEGVTIDRNNNLNLTLAIPTEQFVSIETPGSGSRSTHRRHAHPAL